MTGRIEELVNAQNQEKRNARTQYETLDKRLAVFEPQVVVIDGQSIEVSAEEKKAYDTAVALLQTGKYGDAEKAFKDFNDNFKKSPYRMDALFWWGTSAFANEHYKTAISSQNQLLREFSKGARAADAMMLVASSQAASGSINAAKATLQKSSRPTRKLTSPKRLLSAFGSLIRRNSLRPALLFRVIPSEKRA